MELADRWGLEPQPTPAAEPDTWDRIVQNRPLSTPTPPTWSRYLPFAAIGMFGLAAYLVLSRKR